MDDRRILRRPGRPRSAAAPALLAATLAGVLVVATPAAAREPRVADGEGATSHGPSAQAAASRDRRTHAARHRKQVGTASVYARRFGGRTMADGTRLDLREHVAASRTLPLGTEARVTNLETGRSTNVTVQDRGPYAKGRILDLTPAAAEAIGLTKKEGVAKVEVQPLSLPEGDADRRN